MPERPTAPSYSPHAPWHLVELRMPVRLVRPGIEERAVLARRRRRDRDGWYDPERDHAAAPRVDVACVLERLLRIRGVQRSRVLVRRALLALRENLPERPLAVGRDGIRLRRHHVLVRHGAGHDYAAADACFARCLAAYALAASRTHAPSSCA